jgi:hypothetical protein
MISHQSGANNGMFIWLKWSSQLTDAQARVKQNISNVLGAPNYDKDNQQFYLVKQDIPYASVADHLEAISSSNRGLCVFPHGTDSAGNSQLSIHQYGHLDDRDFKFDNMSNGIILLVIWSKLGTPVGQLIPNRTIEFRSQVNTINQRRDPQVSPLYSWGNVSIYKMGKSITANTLEKWLDDSNHLKPSDIAIMLFPHGRKNQASTMSIKVNEKANTLIN